MNSTPYVPKNAPLFDDTDIDLNNIIDDQEMIEPIDMDGISDEALSDATAMVENLQRIYYNEDFMNRNPLLKKRLNSELESLRVLIKMRKADEVTHDILIKAISGNSGNASLYRALSDMQKTILQITTKMQETVQGLNVLLKNYQLELNFQPDEETETDNNQEEVTDNTYRGSKEFIQSMLEKKEG